MNAVTRLIVLATSSISNGSSALAMREWLRAQGIEFDAGEFNRAILSQVRRYRRVHSRWTEDGRLIAPWMLEGCGHGYRCACA